VIVPQRSLVARVRATAAALLPLLGLQCGDRVGPSACLDDMTIMVGSGVRPTFDWRPACYVNALSIRLVEKPVERVWGVSSPGSSNALRPPIQYGLVPSGADGSSNPADLVAGSAYRLTLYASFDTAVATDLEVLDSVDFVP
jgi:hypothetical protein